MNLLAPLFALDVGDVIRIVVILFIFVIPIVGQLIAKIRQIPPPENRPIPRPPADINVADEIEEFMRRAAQRNAGQDARPVVVQQAPSPVAEPVRAEVVVDKPSGGQTIGSAVRRLDTQDFNQSRLGEEFSQADKQINQHLHQVFDHRVSNLDAASSGPAQPSAIYQPPDLVGATDEVPDSFATGLLELIANPDTLRQAIILNEILHRPKERWA